MSILLFSIFQPFPSIQFGFRHYKDYQAYVWAKGEHTTQVCQILKFEKLFRATANLTVDFSLFHLVQVTFSEEDLPREDCEYILGYYSNNMNSIVGLSSPIKVTKKHNLWIDIYVT